MSLYNFNDNDYSGIEFGKPLIGTRLHFDVTHPQKYELIFYAT